MRTCPAWSGLRAVRRQVCAHVSLPPDHDYTSEEIARAISDYVQLFDRLMKAYLAGKYTRPEIEALYCAEQQRAAILI